MWLRNTGEAKQPSGHCLQLDVPLESKAHLGFRILNKEGWVLSRGLSTATSPVTFHSVCGADSASSCYAWKLRLRLRDWPLAQAPTAPHWQRWDVNQDTWNLEVLLQTIPLRDLLELTCAVNLLPFSTGSYVTPSRVSVPWDQRRWHCEC